MDETLEFYKEQMRQMRVERGENRNIVKKLKEEIKQLKAKKPATRQTKTK